MPSVTDWLATIIASVAVVVSIYAVRESRAAVRETRRTAAQRAAGRAVLAAAMDAGNRLLEDLRSNDPGPREVVWRRYEAWEDMAHAAVTKADPAQLPRYHHPLPKSNLATAVETRQRMLQEIQDRL